MAAGGLSLDYYSVPQRHVFYESEEEEEEEEEEREEAKLFLIEGVVNVQAKLLLVCTTDVGVAFLKSHVALGPQPSLVVSTRHPEKVLRDRYFHRTRGEEEEGERVGELYGVDGKEDIFVYFQLKSLKDEHCNQWSQMLIDATRPETVMILHSSLLHQYYYTEEEEEEEEEVEGGVQFLRSLQSKSWSDKPLASLLSSHNIITGEPAAIISLCQYSSIPASLVVQYYSSSLTLKERVKGLRPLLSRPLLSQSLSTVVHSLGMADKRLSSLTFKPHSDVDTLYT